MLTSQRLPDRSDVNDRMFTARAREEVSGGPCLYGVSDAALANSWIVYVNAVRSIVALRTSFVIIVSRLDGAVIYAGSAHDEG